MGHTVHSVGGSSMTILTATKSVTYFLYEVISRKNLFIKIKAAIKQLTGWASEMCFSGSAYCVKPTVSELFVYTLIQMLSPHHLVE